MQSKKRSRRREAPTLDLGRGTVMSNQTLLNALNMRESITDSVRLDVVRLGWIDLSKTKRETLKIS